MANCLFRPSDRSPRSSAIAAHNFAERRPIKAASGTVGLRKMPFVLYEGPALRPGYGMYGAGDMKLDADNKARLAFAALVLLAAVAAIGWYLSSSSRQTTYQIITQDAVAGLMPDAPAEYH